jgi:hypothetical protein
MRRFTLFTLLYLATGICIMAIAFQHPNITPNAKTSLLVAAGLLYLCAAFTTFPFWHQSVQRSQARLRDKPAWQQKFVSLAKPIGTIIAPWLVITSVLVSALARLPEVIADLLNHNWAIETLASAALGLPIIFLSVENLSVRNQISQ